MADGHDVTDGAVDNFAAIEEFPFATRNKLLKAMRRLVGLEAELRFARSIPDEPESASRRASRPASYFLGVDVGTDIDRLADEIASRVEDLAAMLSQ
jgi:hypothetical protein